MKKELRELLDEDEHAEDALTDLLFDYLISLAEQISDDGREEQIKFLNGQDFDDDEIISIVQRLSKVRKQKELTNARLGKGSSNEG